MKKSSIFILSLAFVLILSSVVIAQGSGTNQTVLDKLWSMLKFLFFDFSQSGEATIVTGLKFFMFVLLFALLYGLSEIWHLRDLSKNIRIVLAISMSAISVLLVPNQLVISVASAYSATFFGGMLAALVISAVYLIFKVFKEPTVANRFTKAIICGIFTGVVGSFSDLTKAGGEGIGFMPMLSAAAKPLSAITDVAEFVTLIFFILTIVYIIGAFIKLSPTEPGDAKDKFVNWWNKPKTPEQMDASVKKDIKSNVDALLAYATKITRKSRDTFDSYAGMHKEIATYLSLVNSFDSSLRKLKPVPTNMYSAIKIVKDLLRDLDAQVYAAEADVSKITIRDFLKSDKYKVGKLLPRDVFAEIQRDLEDKIGTVAKSLT